MPFGGSDFIDKMSIPADGKAFVAEGTIREQYQGLTRMYVGVLQLARNGGKLDITGAAYGMGAPEWRTQNGQEIAPPTGDWHPLLDANGQAVTDASGQPVNIHRWAMELRPDYEHSLHAGPAVGFVLGEMPGGKVTGWIEDGIELTGGPQSKLMISDDAKIRSVLEAVLPDDQVNAVMQLLSKVP